VGISFITYTYIEVPARNRLNRKPTTIKNNQ